MPSQRAENRERKKKERRKNVSDPCPNGRGQTVEALITQAKEEQLPTTSIIYDSKNNRQRIQLWEVQSSQFFLEYTAWPNWRIASRTDRWPQLLSQRTCCHSLKNFCSFNFKPAWKLQIIVIAIYLPLALFQFRIKIMNEGMKCEYNFKKLLPNPHFMLPHLINILFIHTAHPSHFLLYPNHNGYGFLDNKQGENFRVDKNLWHNSSNFV